ncbi:glycosyltransferase [Nocardioides jishulii]|uniref:Glycosyltransferase family 4 protein n=1 Tax=Nocardioides jishulii TaxID=2575440 RepID=A0A4U2YRZ1_9ACTN|nr:glycosyltransferase [Nocardioides jishulii]QCX26480.1 glycosyltransferase family 4 protein [Nocardioides jishulii]TKI63714.1 glycosyltransferase family 4 protein [Nocardioides jishulii]
MKVLHLGFVTPDALFEQVLRNDRRMPVQTQRFGWNFLGALTAAGMEVDAVTVVPASDFPLNRQLVFRRQPFDQNGVSGAAVGFVNVLGVKHWSRHRVMLGEVMRRYRDPEVTRPDVVVVHGVNSALLALTNRVATHFGIPSVVLMTDPPHGVGARDEQPRSALRRVDFRRVMNQLDRFSAGICLTEQLGSAFLPGRPVLVMEGIADVAETDADAASPVGASPVVLYAGGVEEAYGLGALLEAVERSQGEWTLEVCGRGSYLDQVLRAAERSPRVVYRGVLGQAELHEAYRAAAILVNPRPDRGFTRFSFPSKVLEYMTHGGTVASTRLPGIPEEYWDHLHPLPVDGEGMAVALDRLAESDFSAEVVAARRAELRDFLRRGKSLPAQGDRIAEFFTSLTATPSRTQ